MNTGVSPIPRQPFPEPMQMYHQAIYVVMFWQNIFSTLIWYMLIKSFYVKEKNIPHSQHHSCWWTGAKNQGIKSHGIGIVHYDDVIMGAMASQITSLTVVYSTVYSDADQRKHLSSASLAFVRGIPSGPVNSPHKRPVTRKMFPFSDVIMVFVKCFGPSTWRVTVMSMA